METKIEKLEKSLIAEQKRVDIKALIDVRRHISKAILALKSHNFQSELSELDIITRLGNGLGDVFNCVDEGLTFFDKDSSADEGVE